MTASSNTGYVFDHWDDGQTNKRRYDLYDSDITRTAYFQEQSNNSYLLCTYDVNTTSSNTKIFSSISSVSSISIDGGEEINPTRDFMFTTNGQHSVRVNLYDDIESLDNLFYGCVRLVNIDASHVNTSRIRNFAYAFNGCTMLQEIIGLHDLDMSHCGEKDTPPGWTIIGTAGGSYAMMQNCSSLQRIIIPDKCAEISSFMYNHCNSATNTEVYIPASVKKIGGSHCFYDCGKPGVFKRFVVDPASTTFKAWNGILMSIDGTEMYSIPRALEIAGTSLELPEGITKLGELSFSAVSTFTKLVIPNSYTITEYGAGDFKNGINYGNSLSVAIYCNTTVKEYEVKADNPKYISDNGCIYSKDGTHLIAVPYNYTGALSIREGCTHINREAFWTNGYSPLPKQTLLHIPASVTSIESAQITLLNKAVTNGTLTISIDAENAAYALSGGKLIQK